MKLDHQRLLDIKMEVEGNNCSRPNNCHCWTVKKQLALGNHSNLVYLISMNTFVNNFLFNNMTYNIIYMLNACK